LTWRRVSPCSLDHRLSSSSSPMNSSPAHSLGLDAPGQAHSRSSTRVVSPRLGYPSVRAPDIVRNLVIGVLLHYLLFIHRLHQSHHKEIHQRDHCIHLHILLYNLIRDVDSYSPETIMEEDTKIGTTETKEGREDDREEFEVSARDTVVLGIDPRSVPMVDEEIIEPVIEDSSSSSRTRDGTVRSIEDMPVNLDDAIRDFYHHMSEVRVDRIVGIETTQRQLEAD
nr:hypothetical protein [Tanacetum cinerariifolium]